MFKTNLVKRSALLLIYHTIQILSIDAGPAGVEPATSVLETEILPLNYRPIQAE